MSSDWDEIRRLASDLQRAQLSGSIQRLSERNCIEIVAKLVQSGLVEVIYTADGKEYLVPQQLQRYGKDFFRSMQAPKKRVISIDLQGDPRRAVCRPRSHQSRRPRIHPQRRLFTRGDAG